MLKSMRQSVSSPFIKLLLLVLVLSFVSFYGFNRVRSGCNPDTVAEVNGESIGISEYASNLKRSYEFYRNLGLFRGGNEESMIKTLKGRVLENLISTRLKIQEAKKLGLSISDIELAKFIRSQFSDPKTKEFNEKYYDYYLRQTGTGSEQFEARQREYLLATKLDDFVKSFAKISSAEVRGNYINRNEAISLSYIKIDPKNYETKVNQGTEKELANFYSKNPDLFKTAEKRKVEILYIKPQDFIHFTDEDLKRYFKGTFLSNTSEDYKGRRIRASHILFKTSKNKSEIKTLGEAERVYEKIKNGENFENLAGQFNTDATKYGGGDLGYFGRGKMAQEFEEKAFSMKVGEISRPIKTSFGYHIIKVTDIIPEGDISFDRLRNEVELAFIGSIKQDPEKFAETDDRMLKTFNAVKEEMSKFPKRELAFYKERENFHWRETDFFASDGSIKGVIDSAMLVRTAFGLNPGETSRVNQGYLSKIAYLVRLQEIKESFTPKYESVRGKVRKTFIEKRAEEKAKDIAKATLEKIIKAPEKFNSIASANGLSAIQTGSFKRNKTGRIPILGISKDIMQKGFTLDTKNSVVNEVILWDRAYYIVRLKEKTGADLEKFEAEKDKLVQIALEEKQNNLLKDWLNSLQQNAEIKRYEIPEELLF